MIPRELAEVRAAMPTTTRGWVAMVAFVALASAAVVVVDIAANDRLGLELSPVHR